MSTRLSEKDPGETVDLWYDFTAELGDATIASLGTTVVSVDNTLARSTDASPSAILSGAAFQIASGNIVYQAVTGGLHGVDYHVVIKCTDDSVPARTLFGALVLPVRTQ
jgi:hypothetical protein